MDDKYRPFIGKQRENKIREGSRMFSPEHRAYMLKLKKQTRDDLAPLPERNKAGSYPCDPS